MDLDDLIEDLIDDLPKKSLKKLKKKAKKASPLKLLLAAIASFFQALFGGSHSQQSSQPERSKEKPQKPKRSTSKQAQHRQPAQAQNPYAEQIAQAHQYRDRIAMMASKAEPDSMEQLRLETVSKRVAEWTETIEEIVARILSEQEDDLLAEEKKRVPKAIRRLEKQLDETDDKQLREKLARTLENRRAQLVQLEQAGNRQQIAELKIENTLAQLGTLYAQLMSGRMMSERGAYERLSAEVTEEVNALEDYLHALDEIQAQ